jgi:hypothetical protein
MLSVCVVAAACLLGTTLTAHAQSEDSLQFFALDEPIVTTLDQTPPDIALVTTAIVAQMRANDPQDTPPVVFAPALANKLHEQSFRYEGFYLDSITLTFLGPANGPEEGRRLFGKIQFEDELGRRTAAGFGVEYVFDDAEIYVSEAALNLATPVEPDIRLYILPTDKASEMLEEASDNHLEVMAFIAEHAIDVANASSICSCAIVAASFDRLPNNAHLYASASNSETGERIVMGSHFVMNFDGWRVALLDGQIDLSPGSQTTIEALYAPAPAASDEPSTFSVVRSHSLGEANQ